MEKDDTGALEGGSVMSNNVEPNPQCQQPGLPCVSGGGSQMAALSFARCLCTSLSRAFFQRPSAHPLSSGRFLVESWPVGPPNSSTLRELQQDRGSETAGVGWGGEREKDHLGKGAACTNTCARLITSNFRNFVAVSHKAKLPLAAESESWVQTAQGAFLCGLMSPPVLPGFLTQPTDVHLMGR